MYTSISFLFNLYWQFIKITKWRCYEQSIMESVNSYQKDLWFLPLDEMSRQPDAICANALQVNDDE